MRIGLMNQPPSRQLDDVDPVTQPAHESTTSPTDTLNTSRPVRDRLPRSIQRIFDCADQLASRYEESNRDERQRSRSRSINFVRRSSPVPVRPDRLRGGCEGAIRCRATQRSGPLGTSVPASRQDAHGTSAGA
jgi:hypothetical protein